MSMDEAVADLSRGQITCSLHDYSEKEMTALLDKSDLSTTQFFKLTGNFENIMQIQSTLLLLLTISRKYICEAAITCH